MKKPNGIDKAELVVMVGDHAYWVDGWEDAVEEAEVRATEANESTWICKVIARAEYKPATATVKAV